MGYFIHFEYDGVPKTVVQNIIDSPRANIIWQLCKLQWIDLLVHLYSDNTDVFSYSFAFISTLSRKVDGGQRNPLMKVSKPAPDRFLFICQVPSALQIVYVNVQLSWEP